jgi:hypothetical protein
MESVKLFLNDEKVTPDEFREWVDRVTRKLRGMYPTPDGPWATQGGAWFEYPNKIPIRGYHITIDKAGKDLYDEIEIGNIEIHRLGEQFEVVFNYSDEIALAAYFIKFFADFLPVWPETTDAIKQELKEIVIRHGLDEQLIGILDQKYSGEEAISNPTKIPTYSETQVITQPPRIAPTRKGHLEKWVIIWNYIDRKNWRKMGMQPDKICEQLLKDMERHEYRGPIYKEETIRKIIRSGEAGELTKTL